MAAFRLSGHRAVGASTQPAATKLFEFARIADTVAPSPGDSTTRQMPSGSEDEAGVGRSVGVELEIGDAVAASGCVVDVPVGIGVGVPGGALCSGSPLQPAKEKARTMTQSRRKAPTEPHICSPCVTAARCADRTAARSPV
jgi:hypothetical protein